MTDNGTVTGRSAVSIAIDLGWCFAELYDSKRLPGPSRKKSGLPEYLPGLGDMTAHEKARALSAHVGADLAALGKATGAELPNASTIDKALAVPRHKRDSVRSVVHDLYIEVRDGLAGGDPAVALGFGLGRMLADTVLLPTTEQPEVLSREFGKWRLGNAFEWLDDLDATLPPRAAAAVEASLRAWEDWVSQATASGLPIKLPIKKVASGRRFIRPKFDAVAVRALRRQGNLWRRLLTGEQPAYRLLDAKAYVGAAASLLAKARKLTFHYAWKWSWAIVPALGAIAAAVWASVTYAPAGSARVAAVIASAAGFLGVSWTGIRATLGRALRQGESAMWEAEVVAAIGKAATILPKRKLDRPEPPKVDEPDEEAEADEEDAPAGVS